MNYHHYLAPDGGLIRIICHKRPSENTKPARGCWGVWELREGKWELPCFPEITWSTLKTFAYLGKVSVEKP